MSPNKPPWTQHFMSCFHLWHLLVRANLKTTQFCASAICRSETVTSPALCRSVNMNNHSLTNQSLRPIRSLVVIDGTIRRKILRAGNLGLTSWWTEWAKFCRDIDSKLLKCNLVDCKIDLCQCDDAGGAGGGGGGGGGVREPSIVCQFPSVKFPSTHSQWKITNVPFYS